MWGLPACLVAASPGLPGVGDVLQASSLTGIWATQTAETKMARIGTVSFARTFRNVVSVCAMRTPASSMCSPREVTGRAWIETLGTAMQRNRSTLNLCCETLRQMGSLVHQKGSAGLVLRVDPESTSGSITPERTSCLRFDS